MQQPQVTPYGDGEPYDDDAGGVESLTNELIALGVDFFWSIVEAPMRLFRAAREFRRA